MGSGIHLRQIVKQEILKFVKRGRNKGGWKRTLAREIAEKYPDLFDIETARTQIRTLCMASGKSRQGEAIMTNESKPYSKILILDIETAPLKGYFWGLWEQNISAEQLISDWFILTWSAKWLFKNKVYSAKLNSKEAITGNDERIVKSIWQLLEKADIIIAHNGDKFDIKRLNTRFLIHGMHPPMPYISIDTLKHNKKQFAHSSNKLDFINDSLHLRKKMKHEGFPLWRKCCEGDASALKLMEEYNVQDVKILEDHYLRIRSWIKPHPNVNIFITNETVERCNSCSSDDLNKKVGRYATQTAAYETVRCNHCGAIMKERKTMVAKERTPYIKISSSK